MMNGSTCKSGWLTAALILTMLAPAIACGQGSEPAMPIQVQPAAPQLQQMEPRPLDLLVASSDQGDLKIENLVEYCYYNRLPMMSGMNIGMINQLPDAMLGNLASHIVSRQAAFEALYATGSPEEIKQAEETFSDIKSRKMVTRMIKTEVSDKITTPSAEGIEAYYEKHRFQYKQEFSFTMRHLILLTYEDYVVKTGDTLESIARNVCGDPALAVNIRSAEAHRPQRKTEAEDQPPLYEGERLLVPMPAKRAQTVSARLEELLKQLDEGKNFEDLADEYSQGLMHGKVIGPLPSGTRDMLPDLIAVAKETPMGEVSDIFQTKHGFQVIQIVEKKEERQRTLDEMHDEVVRNIKDDQQKSLIKELMNLLYANPALEVYYDVIAKGNSLAPETVIAKVGDKEIYWADTQDLWRTNGQPVTRKLIDERLMRALPALQILLAEGWAQPILDDPQSDISKQLLKIKPEMIGDAYLKMLAQREGEGQVDDAAVQAFYEANKARFFMLPPSVKFSSMLMVVPPDEVVSMDPAQLPEAVDKLKVALTEKLQGVDSPEAFTALAEDVNTAVIALGVNPPGTAGDFFPIEKVEKVIAKEIADLEPGQWTKPFEFSERSVMTILMEAKRAATYRPLADVLDDARQGAQRAAINGQLKRLEAEFAQKANLQIKL